MKQLVLSTLCAALMVSAVQARSTFNKSKDILIAQFDSRPDPDDIHSIAALGSILAHKNYNSVNCYAVAGAYGIQPANAKYIPAPNLFNLAFGTKNEKWTDAHNEHNASVTRIKNKVKPILLNGGKVWVQEAGQSNITADWLRALKNDGVSASLIKRNVIVVQHSVWNEDMTASADLSYVKSKATYQAIDGGNSFSGPNRGPDTPSYKTATVSYLNNAKTSRNATAKALWVEADRVIDNHPNKSKNWAVKSGGVDFSDCVENYWIFSIANAGSVGAFWSTFVTNATSDGSDGGDTPSGAPIGKTVTFKAKVNGKYVRVDTNGDSVNWRVTANSSGEWTTSKFKVVNAGDGTIALIAKNQKYVCADKALDSSNRPLAANRTAIGGWEKFTWISNSDGTVSLKSASNGKYVKADKRLDSRKSPLAANSTSIGNSEKFTVSIK